MTARQGLLTGGLGLLLGVALTLGMKRSCDRPHRMNPDRLLVKFTRELSLRDDQQKAVKAALDDSAAKLESLHQDCRAKLVEIRLTTRAQIRKVLDEDQQKRFDDMSARWDARHAQKEEQ